MNFHMNSVWRKAVAAALGVGMSLATAGCGGGESTPPTTRLPQMTVCPQSVISAVRPQSTCDAGGGGSGYTPMSQRMTLFDGDISTGSWDGNTAHNIGSSGTNSSGQSLGSATVAYTIDSQGQDTAAYNANVPAYHLAISATRCRIGSTLIRA